MLAALDLAEPEPLWTTVIDRLRLAAAGEGNAGRARAALVYALAKSGDARGAKAELGEARCADAARIRSCPACTPSSTSAPAKARAGRRRRRERAATVDAELAAGAAAPPPRGAAAERPRGERATAALGAQRRPAAPCRPPQRPSRRATGAARDRSTRRS